MVKVIWQQAASPPHMDGSMILARLRQCAPHLIHVSFGLPESKSQTAFRLVQPFLHTVHSRESLYFTTRRTFSLKITIPMGGSGSLSNTGFLVNIRAHNSNGFSPPKGHSPQFSAHICYGHMAAWINTPFGMEVGLGPLCVRW